MHRIFVPVIDAVQPGNRNVSSAGKEKMLKSCIIFPRSSSTIATVVFQGLSHCAEPCCDLTHERDAAAGGNDRKTFSQHSSGAVGLPQTATWHSLLSPEGILMGTLLVELLQFDNL